VPDGRAAGRIISNRMRLTLSSRQRCSFRRNLAAVGRNGNLVIGSNNRSSAGFAPKGVARAWSGTNKGN
jgi:hypothetical protein